MTIRAGDYVVVCRGADGKPVAIKADRPELGAYCVRAITADGERVALRL